MRPVWLFSMDSEGFASAPMTTGGLLAYYRRYGRQRSQTLVQLQHFTERDQWQQWWLQELPSLQRQILEALQQGLNPLVGISLYTWNAAEFLELMRSLRRSCPGLLLVVGGPHAQEAHPYLQEGLADAVVLGEGEITFTELLDTPISAWPSIAGLALIDGIRVYRSAERPRVSDLDHLPSALEVVALTDASGAALYPSIAYETSRGCPYRCAFCEWGSGDIGTTLRQFSLERVEQDWRRIMAAGIDNIWLADSNFGALKSDLAKTELICELKARTGRPRSFATSWSKKHSNRVQQMVLMLHQAGLLPHYQLALQTLTPLALELSHRKNMDANNYTRIARQMADHGVPIAAELIWGLPGDNLDSFAQGLDQLMRCFPALNIFGYTLLPGTEFHARRQEYRIETVPVAGYGQAKGEYVVACHTFDVAEGQAGYWTISAYLILVKGYLLPLTARYLALRGDVAVAALLCRLLQALLDEDAVLSGVAIYEQRADHYLQLLRDREASYARLQRLLRCELLMQGYDDAEWQRVARVIALDGHCCPRAGTAHAEHWQGCRGDDRVLQALGRLQLPDEADWSDEEPCVIRVDYPGGLGEILREPDAGEWLRGQWRVEPSPPLSVSAVQLLAVHEAV